MSVTEVLFLDEGDFEAAARGVTGDACAVDAAADHEEVERAAFEGVEIPRHGPCHGGLMGTGIGIHCASLCHLVFPGRGGGRLNLTNSRARRSSSHGTWMTSKVAGDTPVSAMINVDSGPG